MRFLTKTFAFIKRDFQVESSYKLNFILEVLNSILPIILFYFVSKMISPSEELLQKYGGNYFFFVMIGIAFARYFHLALGTFSGSIQRAQLTGCLEAMLSTQTSPQVCILMSSLYSLISAFIQLAIMFFLSWFFLDLDLSQTSLLSTLVVFLLALLTFISFGIVSAAGIVVLKKGDPLGWLVTSTSLLLGGAYFPVELMPGWLQALAAINPTTYALDALRLTILKGYTVGMVLHQTVILGGMALLLLPLSLHLFLMAVQKAKKDGTLVQY